MATIYIFINHHAFAGRSGILLSPGRGVHTALVTRFSALIRVCHCWIHPWVSALHYVPEALDLLAVYLFFFRVSLGSKDIRDIAAQASFVSIADKGIWTHLLPFSERRLNFSQIDLVSCPRVTAKGSRWIIIR